MKKQKDVAIKVLDQIDPVSGISSEDFGFSYNANNCSGGGGSCRSCGGGCYGCYTPSKGSKPTYQVSSDRSTRLG